MYQPIPQVPVPETGAIPGSPAPNALQAQAQMLAARLSPQTNMARQGGIAGGISPGQGHPNPWIARSPWGAGPMAGGGIAPAAVNLPGYASGTPTQLARWTSPQSGAAIG
jgi:hypothetical protein